MSLERLDALLGKIKDLKEENRTLKDEILRLKAVDNKVKKADKKNKQSAKKDKSPSLKKSISCRLNSSIFKCFIDIINKFFI
jgi:cell shape-determining protein MreC